MAQFKNNNVGQDKDGNFALRAETCAVGIQVYYGELSFTEDQRDEIVAFAPEFRTALYRQAEEKADIDEVYVNLDNAEILLRSRYVACQTHIKAEMLFLDAGTVEHLNELFDIDGALPKGRGDMIKVVNVMIEAWDQMDVELPHVSLVASLFEDLRTERDSVKALIASIPLEKRESHLATYEKNQLRKQGELLMRRVFHRAVALWGNEDYRLLELGFVPKSQIWTPGSGEPEPQPEEFPAWPGPTGKFTLKYWGEGVVEIVYGGVQESTIGWLHRSVPGAEDWIEVNKHLPMNAEDILPFREMHVPIGMWEYRFIPMRGVEKGVASFALIEVV